MTMSRSSLLLRFSRRNSVVDHRIPVNSRKSTLGKSDGLGNLSATCLGSFVNPTLFALTSSRSACSLLSGYNNTSSFKDGKGSQGTPRSAARNYLALAASAVAAVGASSIMPFETSTSCDSTNATQHQEQLQGEFVFGRWGIDHEEDYDRTLRDPMTSYAVHAMVRQIKRERAEYSSKQKLHQKQDRIDVQNHTLTTARVLASSSFVSSSKQPQVQQSQQLSKAASHPDIENDADDLQDPMTSYAVAAEIRDMKRRGQDTPPMPQIYRRRRTSKRHSVPTSSVASYCIHDSTNTPEMPEKHNNEEDTCYQANEHDESKLLQAAITAFEQATESTALESPVTNVIVTLDQSTNQVTTHPFTAIMSNSMAKPQKKLEHSSMQSSASTSKETGDGGLTADNDAVEELDEDAIMTLAEARIEEATRKAKQHSGGLKIFSGNGNMSLALEICRHLGVNLGKATVARFADGEVNVVIHENVRGKDVYIVQPTGPPVNDNIMELLLMVSTLRRSSARRITVVIPYYGYARQDRKMQARVPISAADVARLMESMGIDRVIAVDLHCGQIQGFFGPRVPVDNLDGGIVGLDYFGCKDLHNPVIVSPDAGGVYRAKNFKDGLEQKYEMHDLAIAMIVKQRAKAGVVDQMDLVGDVKDCDCIIVDDMIDTAGTLVKAADVLIANGARRVFAFASHGLLSGPGNERIANSQLEEVVILNTLPTSPQREANEKLTELSVAPLLAQAIFNIHAKKSISALFK